MDSRTPVRIEYFGVFPIERGVLKPENRKTTTAPFGMVTPLIVVVF
jgi:hypothetical protein